MGSKSITNAYIKVGWTTTSDERDKTNFAEVPHGLSFVNDLQPVKFNFKTSRIDSTPIGNAKYGFKAQDVLALEGEDAVVIDTEEEDHLKIQSDSLIPILVKAIQELSAEVEALKNA